MLESLISAPSWACQALIWVGKFVLEATPLLDVRHCPMLQPSATSRKTNDANLRKRPKT